MSHGVTTGFQVYFLWNAIYPLVPQVPNALDKLADRGGNQYRACFSDYSTMEGNMMNMAINQRRWLLRVQSGDSETLTHRPVEVPAQNIPPEIQPQKRTQEAPQSSQTPQVQSSQTLTEVPQPTEQPLKSGDV
jgi:hypothetical protein